MGELFEDPFTLVRALAAFVLIWVTWRLLAKPRQTPKLRSVVVLVLGDVGRSPRMMYHAESFARNGFQTCMVGYRGATPIAALLTEPLVSFCYLPEPPKRLNSLPFLLLAPLKISYQIASIVFTLLISVPTPPEFIIVQNPPSIPTLALVWLAAKLRGCKVILDWHNLGYTILALRLGSEEHPIVRVAKRFERTFGHSAYAHLFVTQAMHDRLVKDWDLQGLKVVLHDRPPAHFHRATAQEMHELFLRLGPAFAKNEALSSFLPDNSPPQSTPFTRMSTVSEARHPAVSTAASLASSASDFSAPTAQPVQRADRPALVVSSTSWTPDEDFGLLLDALALYDAAAERAGGALPRVLAVVTGRGPLRDKYMREAARRQSGADGKGGWAHVRCVSLWLEAGDYPLLLGAADLGISLHSSSSALDLPMKVVDMFGCGLPVCALDFACLDELVHDGKNGLVFKNAEQLAAQMETLLASFPNSKTLASLREGVSGGGGWKTWAENWDHIMRPLVLTDVHQ